MQHYEIFRQLKVGWDCFCCGNTILKSLRVLDDFTMGVVGLGLGLQCDVCSSEEVTQCESVSA